MSEIYTFSQHIFQNRAYRLTFFWLFEDTPTRNHHFSSQNKSQQQKNRSGASSFCLDRTQIYMKSEHLAEAKRKARSRALPTIIYYKETTTFNNNNNLYEWSGSSFEFHTTELRLHPSLGKVFNSRFGSAHTPKPTLSCQDTTLRGTLTWKIQNPQANIKRGDPITHMTTIIVIIIMISASDPNS